MMRTTMSGVPRQEQRAPEAPSVNRGDLSPAEAEAILETMARLASANPRGAGARGMAAKIEATPEQETQTAQSQSAIWKAERRYRALIEQIPVVTFMAAMDETIHELYVSPQIESLLGFSQEEWLENPFLWYNQLHPEDRESWQREFARTCTTGVQFKSEYRFIARDGRVIWVHGECQLIRDEAGQPLFLQGVAYDITESKRAEAALQRMHHDLELMVEQRTAELAKANELLRAEIGQRQEAQQALAMQASELARSNTELSQFAYVASHDLQEPLRMMGSFAQLLAERYSGHIDADADQFIHFITDGAGRMQRLINDLLHYSRVGKGDIAMAAVDCNSALGIARENLGAIINERQVCVKAERLPVVIGNEGQLVQLFQNLIGNGIKFARTDAASEIRVGARKQDNQWVLWVADNGIGFDPQYADRIFLIFQRLHSRMNYPGTGIGLAICRKIVERHEGRIWAESEPGRGSTFYFTLPATEVKDERCDSQ
jgi:PAS domain S-box-containing protein